MKTVKVSDLKEGDEFRLIGKRKWKTINKTIELVDHDDVPPLGRKFLIIHTGCMQIARLKDSEVQLLPK